MSIKNRVAIVSIATFLAACSLQIPSRYPPRPPAESVSSNLSIVPNLAQSFDKSWLKIDNKVNKERIIYIGKEIDDKLAIEIIAVMLYLDDKNPGQDIMLFINSPGGYVTSGMAIYDAMQSLKSDVITINVGLSASMAAFLLAAGTPGKRLALSNARVMLHNPSEGERVSSSPEIVKEIVRIRHQLHEILARHTGQPVEKIEKDLQQDFFMSAQEAKDYGLIDRVIEKPRFSP